MQLQQTATFQELIRKNKAIPKSNLIRQAKLLSQKISNEQHGYATERKREIINSTNKSQKINSLCALPTLISKKTDFILDTEKAKDILKNFNIKLIRQKMDSCEKIHRKLSQHNIPCNQQLNITFGQHFRLKAKSIIQRQQEYSVEQKDSCSTTRVMSHSQQRMVNKLFQ